jgi:hypothetical protein
MTMKWIYRGFGICLVSLILSSPQVFGQEAGEVEPEIRYLQAEADSEAILDSVEIEVGKADSRIVRITGEVDLEHPVGYNITINETENTYCVRVMEEEPLRAHLSQLHQLEGEEEGLTLQEVSPESVKLKPKFIEVAATTVDPLLAPLCATWHRLVWLHDGKVAKYHSRKKVATPWNPSAFGTHWFTRECKYTVLDRSKAQSVRSQVYASYYNYDFGLDSQITAVSHRITLTGLSNGKSKYDVSWFKSGEAHYLLGLAITVAN